MKLFEWKSSSFEAHKGEVIEFIDYLSLVWQNRNRFIELEEEPSEEEQQEEKIQKQRFFDFTLDGKISARNYVGVVQFDDIRVEVYPKIFADDAPENSSQWQINLFYWLSHCLKIRFPFSFADVSKLNLDDYLELLIYIFSNYILEIISSQPFQAYQTVEEQTTFLKGRLSFDNYVKNNLITGNWQNFYCAHEPFVYDNQFNRIIKYVTRRLSIISKNGLNKEKLNEILFILHDVTDIRCTAEDCDKVKLNPLFEDHKHILELCRLYLSNQVIDMSSDDSKNFCFLLPMEYIFEGFIFGFIADKWPNLNIRGQSTDYLALWEGNKVFQIRNDIYIKNQLIIDTKYKIRAKNDGLKKSGVSQNDLYQMVSYALRRNCRNVLLLYPQTKTSIKESVAFEVPSEMLDEPLQVFVESIDISFEDVREADEVIYERVRGVNGVFS